MKSLFFLSFHNCVKVFMEEHSFFLNILLCFHKKYQVDELPTTNSNFWNHYFFYFFYLAVYLFYSVLVFSESDKDIFLLLNWIVICICIFISQSNQIVYTNKLREKTGGFRIKKWLQESSKKMISMKYSILEKKSKKVSQKNPQRLQT